MKKAGYVLLLLISSYCMGQNKYTLSGYVKDSSSAETLIGATIAVNGKGNGISSNQYGFFSITLPEGNYTITSSFVGYQTQLVSIDLHKNQTFTFQLAPRSYTNEEV